MFCEKCGKELPDGVKFCRFCGSSIGEKKFCPKCGSEIEGNETFCEKCGANLQEAQKVVAPVQKEEVKIETKKQTEVAEKHKISILVNNILGIVFCVLAPVLSFMLFSSTSLAGEWESQNLGKYLKDTVNTINMLADFDAPFLFIIHSYIYEVFLPIVSILIISIFSIIGLIKSIIGLSTQKDTKGFSFVPSITVLLGILIAFYTVYIKAGEFYEGIGIGVTVSFIVGLVFIISSCAVNYLLNKKDLRYILNCGLGLLAVFGIVMVMNVAFGISNQYEGMGLVPNIDVKQMGSSLYIYSSDLPDELSSHIIYACMMQIFTFFLAIPVAVIVGKLATKGFRSSCGYTKNNFFLTNSIVGLVFAVIFAGTLLLLGGAFNTFNEACAEYLSAPKDSAPSVTIGVGAILFVVFSIGCLVLSIVCKTLDKEQE